MNFHNTLLACGKQKISYVTAHGPVQNLSLFTRKLRIVIERTGLRPDSSRHGRSSDLFRPTHLPGPAGPVANDCAAF